jgi:hypothetical protein
MKESWTRRSPDAARRGIWGADPFEAMHIGELDEMTVDGARVGSKQDRANDAARVEAKRKARILKYGIGEASVVKREKIGKHRFGKGDAFNGGAELVHWDDGRVTYKKSEEQAAAASTSKADAWIKKMTKKLSKESLGESFADVPTMKSNVQKFGFKPSGAKNSFMKKHHEVIVHDTGKWTHVDHGTGELHHGSGNAELGRHFGARRLHETYDVKTAAKELHPSSRVGPNWKKQPSSVRMQMKDKVSDQDNETPEMKVKRAQALRRWADSKKDNPAFGGPASQARQHAAGILQAHRPKAVREDALDEISRALAMRYSRLSKKDAQYRASAVTSKSSKADAEYHSRKFANRMVGSIRAKKRLEKESVDEAVLGGEKYRGKENPNLRSSADHYRNRFYGHDAEAMDIRRASRKGKISKKLGKREDGHLRAADVAHELVKRREKNESVDEMRYQLHRTPRQCYHVHYEKGGKPRDIHVDAEDENVARQTVRVLGAEKIHKVVHKGLAREEMNAKKSLYDFVSECVAESDYHSAMLKKFGPNSRRKQRMRDQNRAAAKEAERVRASHQTGAPNSGPDAPKRTVPKKQPRESVDEAHSAHQLKQAHKWHDDKRKSWGIKTTDYGAATRKLAKRKVKQHAKAMAAADRLLGKKRFEHVEEARVPTTWKGVAKHYTKTGELNVDLLKKPVPKHWKGSEKVNKAFAKRKKVKESVEEAARRDQLPAIARYHASHAQASTRQSEKSFVKGQKAARDGAGHTARAYDGQADDHFDDANVSRDKLFRARNLLQKAKHRASLRREETQIDELTGKGKLQGMLDYHKKKMWAAKNDPKKHVNRGGGDMANPEGDYHGLQLARAASIKDKDWKWAKHFRKYARKIGPD